MENPEKKEEKPTEEKLNEKSPEKNPEKKIETQNKKPEKGKKVIKEFAIANGKSLRISAKYSSDVCRIIKGKSPENAIKRLNEVINKKRAVPMERRETAHQKGKGISGGKFPVNVCKSMIELIKQANNNANVNGIENQIIFIAKANKASAPFKSGGRRAKRAHIYLEIRDKTKLNEKKPIQIMNKT
jgi:large subunit ribosomal protein L22